MHKIASLPDKDREALFHETAVQCGMAAAIVEKDFWVCYTLSHLFSCPEISNNIIFKGGTCLSKVFNLIERFSEDIDLILNWGILTDADPRAHRSRSRQNKFNKELDEAAVIYIENILRPLIDELVSPICSASVLPDDGHVLRIDYPSVFENSYILPYIKLEIGPLAAWHPHDKYKIKPYAAEAFPELFSDPELELRATKVERIFWEKATILHSEAHRPAQRQLPLRYSRHYYDVYQMAHSPVKNAALADIDLLQEVAAFKEQFYYAGWADYAHAKPGSMVLYPPDHVLEHLADDYKQMREMIYGEYPDFSEIMETIKNLELEINGLAVRQDG